MMMNVLCTSSLDSHGGTDPKKFLGNPRVFQKLRKRDRVGGGRDLAVMEVEVGTEVEEERVKDEEEKEDRGRPKKKEEGRERAATDGEGSRWDALGEAGGGEGNKPVTRTYK